MAAEVSFPNSMVDRITPATEDEHRQLLRDEYGVEDAWPVIAEPFLQWVIEDTFVVGRPRWELAMPSDVLVTSNVEPYELMKLGCSTRRTRRSRTPRCSATTSTSTRRSPTLTSSRTCARTGRRW